jgi:hypothetical protein
MKAWTEGYQTLANGVLTAFGFVMMAPAAPEIAGVAVTEAGLATVAKHLAQFGHVPENAAMLQRLQTGMRTTQDLNFYVHELKEAALMAGGMADRAAHLATLKWQGIEYKAGYEAALYARDVIKANWESFSSAARKAAGL